MNTQEFSLDEPYPFGKMECGGDGQIALKSVNISGDIEGLLFSSTIRQEYKNETDEALEVIYTFPVGWGTILLGLKANIGGKELTGTVVEKADAEKQYEEAVSQGDSAIMVQKSGSGLYTANLGNIASGESVIVELHCAQLLNIVQGMARLCIPTVIGERYGDPYCEGGLARHESVEPDANAKYPFTLGINVRGEMAKGEIGCPSHSIKMSPNADGITITLDSGAALDRDFILLLHGLENNSSALAIKEDDNSYMLAASFAPQMQKDNISPLGLKILVDCSGSMDGESIRQAQKGLQKVLSLLRPEDLVSYSRFGSNVAHTTKCLLICERDNLKKLGNAIAKTDADMGGTEMNGALISTFNNIRNPTDIPPAVLLITDGDVWEVKDIVTSAKKSGHRVFTIGVGSAPAESLLRDLAHQTGGACEFVTPNENMADAIVRMFQRMRGAIASNIRIDWGAEAQWQSSMPKYIYDGETIHCFAAFNRLPEAAPKLQWHADSIDYTAQAQNIETCQNEDLLRMGRSIQMDEIKGKKEKLALALKYQLVSDLASLILVHERPEGEKLEGLPKVQQVPQMHAYGHGCNPGFIGACFCAGAVEDFCIMGAEPSRPVRPKKRKSKNYHAKLINKLADRWNSQVMNNNMDISSFMDIEKDQSCEIEDAIDEMDFVDELEMLDDEQKAALFLLWVLNKTNKLRENERHTMRKINAALKGLPESVIEAANQHLDEWYAQN